MEVTSKKVLTYALINLIDHSNVWGFGVIKPGSCHLNGVFLLTESVTMLIYGGLLLLFYISFIIIIQVNKSIFFTHSSGRFIVINSNIVAVLNLAYLGHFGALNLRLVSDCYRYFQ